MNILERLKHFRAGAAVRRAHTIPVIDEKEGMDFSYTVARHSFECATLLILLKPDYSRELMEAMLLHDLHERSSGDIPSFAKTPDFRTLEERLQKKLGTDHDLLSAEDCKWFKAIDSLELLLYCRDQRALGNQMIGHVEKRIREWFVKNLDVVPAPVALIVASYTAGPLMPLGA